MSAASFNSPHDLLAAVGTNLGPSEWVEIDQARIQAFADATNDQQWIHTDPVRAASGPYGATIAHGFLTLSLTAAFTLDLFDVKGTQNVVNYGADKLRFLQPVVVGSRVRVVGEITGATEGPNGVKLEYRLTVEIEGQEKPALVVDSIALFVPSA